MVAPVTMVVPTRRPRHTGLGAMLLLVAAVSAALFLIDSSAEARKLFCGVTNSRPSLSTNTLRQAQPRKFGYVLEWNDLEKEGVIVDQEDREKKFLVIPDQITRSWRNHKSLQIFEMVEYTASDEVDAATDLPLAYEVTGPKNRRVKGSFFYNDRLLRTGSFPKRMQDDEEDTPQLRGREWYDSKNKKSGDDD
mmetsp:Transcript_48461/g.113417  ORF Transcript_48461/g.113417 Transcript_48461/m.113417 type:complete len:193 (+) Transcript_48461:38-616(+)